MANKKPKFYVVWQGRHPGVYTSWDEASQQVNGFSGAKFESFGSMAAAREAFGRGGPVEIPDLDPDLPEFPEGSIAVDAACSGNPGLMEYRGVDIDSGAELFHVGPLEEGTNNVGEFLAIVHALALFQKAGQTDTPIYSDSETAQAWIRRKQCGTSLARTPRNAKIFELIARAEKWLSGNPVTNPILKWDTENWGEIPADFGRK